MKEHPILFSAPMVLALLSGAKTVTRRIAKGDAHRFGVPGDRLWVRETWRTEERESDLLDGIRFRADGAFVAIPNTAEAAELWGVVDGKRKGNDWRPSIFMPRWASRLTLEIVDVRQEALVHVDDDEARLEGVGSLAAFVDLWKAINSDWDDTTLVWRVAFRVIGGAR